MRSRVRRKSLFIAVPAAAVIAALAVAVGTLDVLILVCPSAVPAGSPITGYAAGGAVPMTVVMLQAGQAVPDQNTGDDGGDPNFFVFATTEPQAGSSVTVKASDAAGATVAKSVQIL